MALLRPRFARSRPKARRCRAARPRRRRRPSPTKRFRPSKYGSKGAYGVSEGQFGSLGGGRGRQRLDGRSVVRRFAIGRRRPCENRIGEQVADHPIRHAPDVLGLDAGAPDKAGAVGTPAGGGRARRVLHAGAAAGYRNRNAAGNGGASREERRSGTARAEAALVQFRVMCGALRGGGVELNMRR